jgi:hypothetical protein
MEGVVTLFLVAAFMAGMVGCMGDGGGGGVEYTLDISSTDGGEVVNPGEGTFTHAAGYALLLGASPDPGFHFVSWSGDVSTIGDANSFVTNIRMNGDYSIVAKFEPGPQYSPGVAAGTFHTVGLQKCPILLPEVFSTPISDSRRDYGQCNLGGWTDIIQVAAGSAHTVGLRGNQTVLARGDNNRGQCNVGSWTNIIQIAAGNYHTVGLCANETVVATAMTNPNLDCGQSDVGDWTSIVQVAAGLYHTVGLKDNGTVVATEIANDNCDYGQCDVAVSDGWKHIVQVAAGPYHTVGVKDDGTVISTSITNPTVDYGQCSISGWTDIVQVAAGTYHTVGLCRNTTMVAVGSNASGQCDVDFTGDASGWFLIAQVAAADFHTVGLRCDGTVLATMITSSTNDVGQWDVAGWDLTQQSPCPAASP